MKKLVMIMLSVIALVSCGNGVSTKEFKDDLIVCFKNSNAMTSDLAHQLIKDYGEDARWKTTDDCVDLKLDSIVRAAYKPLVEKYGEEYIVEFYDRNLYEKEEGKYSKEVIEEYKAGTIDGFYYYERVSCWAFVLLQITKGDEMKAKDYEWKAIREIKTLK